MKVNELMASIHRKDFNMEKELKVKKYIPFEEKKLIAMGILYECTEMVDGVLKLDSVQQYLSYVKYMIIKHTNLEYTNEDYDMLCSTDCNGDTLLNTILDCFGPDAKECSRILNLMLDDRMRENSSDCTIGKFLNGLNGALSTLADSLKDKIDNFDMAALIPDNMDKGKMIELFEKYM